MALHNFVFMTLDTYVGKAHAMPTCLSTHKEQQGNNNSVKLHCNMQRKL